MNVYFYPVVNIRGATGPAGPGVRNTRLVSINTANINSNDFYVGVNNNNPVSCILPVGESGLYIVVKDESGAASANHITVHPQSGDSIDGVTDGTAVINTNNQSITFIYRAGWRII
jgi:hypothetical protein